MCADLHNIMRGPEKWRNYRHRFTPWLALNWSSRQVKRTDVQSSRAQEKRALSQLLSLLEKLDSALPRLSVREYRKLLQSPEQLRLLHVRGTQVLHEVFGFSLELSASRLEGGGRGVMVGRGRVPEGHLTGLYPGTVYLPQEPLFFQSLRNTFIFRCADGVMIDGNHRGLSKWIYKSCVYRDVVGVSVASDVTWLSTLPSNPLAVGQFVNNHTRELPSNVEYVEVTIPSQWPLRYLRFIPNSYYGLSTGHDWNRPLSTGSVGGMRCVALLSTAAIASGEEIYSSYFTLVHGGKHS